MLFADDRGYIVGETERSLAVGDLHFAQPDVHVVHSVGVFVVEFGYGFGIVGQAIVAFEGVGVSGGRENIVVATGVEHGAHLVVVVDRRIEAIVFAKRACGVDDVGCPQLRFVVDVEDEQA